MFSLFITLLSIGVYIFIYILQNSKIFHVDIMEKTVTIRKFSSIAICKSFFFYHRAAVVALPLFNLRQKKKKKLLAGQYSKMFSFN